ncbi:MAG: hypothetical protein D6737_17250 [Chloroflexi bacterium]|nr:MAG: hypothetical protein D6737_17250 [Chloroflexota bacterium]
MRSFVRFTNLYGVIDEKLQTICHQRQLDGNSFGKLPVRILFAAKLAALIQQKLQTLIDYSRYIRVKSEHCSLNGNASL